MRIVAGLALSLPAPRAVDADEGRRLLHGIAASATQGHPAGNVRLRTVGQWRVASGVGYPDRGRRWV